MRHWFSQHLHEYLNNDRWCVLFDIPKNYYVKADMALASAISLASVTAWVSEINSVLSMVGLGLGVFIAGIRAWKTWRDRHTKD